MIVQVDSDAVYTTKNHKGRKDCAVLIYDRKTQDMTVMAEASFLQLLDATIQACLRNGHATPDQIVALGVKAINRAYEFRYNSNEQSTALSQNKEDTLSEEK